MKKHAENKIKFGFGKFEKKNLILHAVSKIKFRLTKLQRG